MFHPLLEDPKKMKDQELENKILDLSRKYHIAARFGQGSVCTQIITILDVLKEELNKRQRQSLESANKNNKGLDDLINVE